MLRLRFSHSWGQLLGEGIESRILSILTGQATDDDLWTKAVKSWRQRGRGDIRGVKEVELTEFGHSSSLEERERQRPKLATRFPIWVLRELWCHSLGRETQEGKVIIQWAWWRPLSYFFWVWVITDDFTFWFREVFFRSPSLCLS